MSYSKKDVRQESRKSLLSISDEDYHLKSLSLSNNILTLFNRLKDLDRPIDFFHPNSIIGAYAPLRDEPKWFLSFNKEWENIAFPKLGKSKFELLYYKRKLEELEESLEFGALILTPKLKEGQEPEVTPSCLLIPGLGFSRDGNRLGRGKGFYDRYLENYKGIKIGICFNEILKQSIPREDHDEVLDYIVTDLEIIKIK